MKKILSFISVLAVTALLFAGCGAPTVADDKISVVCTNFPVYDWVNELVAGYEERYEVTLLAKGGDLHSYQPTAGDIAAIQTCDLFVYVGGVSDLWAEEIVTAHNVNSLKLSEVLKDGLLCGDEEHHNNHGHEGEDFDEHVWLSLKLAGKSVDAIYEKIAEFAEETDAGEHVAYTKNKDDYKWYLEELDGKYKAAVEGSRDKTIVFADRFPFLYMTEDYGIECIAAFPGCSADRDASFEVIARLASAVDDYEKKTVLVLENSNQSVADTVIKSTEKQNADTAIMNSCQTITEQKIEQGADYIHIMEENLESLKAALQ